MATNKVTGRSSYELPNGLYPEKGPRGMPQTYDFTSVTSIDVDFTQTEMLDRLEYVQTIYVDNSLNASSFSIYFNSLNQTLTWPPNSQGYLPVLCSNPPKFTVSSVGGVIVAVEFLSIALPAIIWSALSAGGGGSGGAVSITPAAATDGSSTITTGGTAQNLFAATIPTNGYAVYNPDPTNDLWISDTTTAAANGTGSIRVAANGGGYESPLMRKPIQAVSIIGATTGQKFTASRW